jgi:hypothetical protein
MGQAAPFKNSFQPYELEELQRAFDTVWAALKSHEVFTIYTSDEELRRVLCDRLYALACSGIRDAEQLQTVVLTSLQPRPSTTAS